MEDHHQQHLPMDDPTSHGEKNESNAMMAADASNDSERRERTTATTEEEGQSSPTTSAVSVSSVAPTLVSALLEQRLHPAGNGIHFPFDLTPVTSNTAASDLQSSSSMNLRQRANTLPRPRASNAALVSPPDPHPSTSVPSADHHLSLPNDLGRHTGQSLQRGSSNVTMPLLRVSSSGDGRAPTSVVVPPAPASMDDGDAILQAVPFPTRKKYFSFTNREQYEDAAAMEGDFSEGHYHSYEVPGSSAQETEETAEAQHPQHYFDAGLIPYQPARPQDAMVELPPEEELSQIFATRGVRQNNSSSTFDSDEKAHRLLPEAGSGRFLMERQGSDVPSLHLAHRLSTTTLDNGSVTTHTTLNTLDDDDFLGTGHHSWSSHNPTAAAPPLVEDVEAEAAVSPSHRRQESGTPSVVVEGLDEELLLHDHHQPMQARNNEAPPQEEGQRQEDNDTIMAVDGRMQREQEALEWLQSLQLETSPGGAAQGIAEAASSKFLCNSTTSPVHSPSRKSRSALLPQRPPTGAAPILP